MLSLPSLDPRRIRAHIAICYMVFCCIQHLRHRLVRLGHPSRTEPTAGQHSRTHHRRWTVCHAQQCVRVSPQNLSRCQPEVECRSVCGGVLEINRDRVTTVHCAGKVLGRLGNVVFSFHTYVTKINEFFKQSYEVKKVHAVTCAGTHAASARVHAT